MPLTCPRGIVPVAFVPVALKKEGWIVMPQEYVMVEEGKGVN